MIYFEIRIILKEASCFDQINMTKNRLEYDRKIITLTNMNNGTWPKDYTDEHDVEHDQNTLISVIFTLRGWSS